MAIIYSYPTVIPTNDDLLLGTDTGKSGNPTKNFTIKSIADLLVGTASGLGATLTQSNDARIVNADGSFGANQSAINFLNLQGTGSVSFESFLTIGGAQINGTIGLGFTSFTYTAITGTLQTAAQPNITSLGVLTSLKVGNTTPAITSIVTAFTNPGDDIKLATTKAIVDYVATKPNPETLAETLANGNVTGGTDIAVSAADDITFTDTSKIIMGAGSDLQIYHDGTNSYIDESGAGGLILKSTLVTIQDPTGNETMATFDDDGSVDLYHDNSKKFETTATGVDIAGVIKVSDGVESSPSYTFTGDTNTGVFLAAANRVGISGGGVLGLTVDATDTVVEGNFTVGGDFISLSTTTATFGGKVSGSDPTVDIDFATKGYVDGEVDGKTLSYKVASVPTYQMNLFLNDL